MAAPSYPGRQQQQPMAPNQQAPMMPQQMGQPVVQSGLPDIVSSTLLCKWGQDIVQEITTRTSEIFSLLKGVVPPTGIPLQTQILEEKKAKIAEHMKLIEFMFKKLKMVYDKVVELSSPYEYISVDSLIPYKEGPESGNGRGMIHENKIKDENLINKRNQLAITIKAKNDHLKMIIDQLRNLSFDINTMLAMKKPETTR
ncbi:mediator of RNA polymerase II transcription subunit 30-like [Panonychus citri]|uniref:mediator of RNA polymerase II transcription subunit 30-like n=1 Tax=Panonychus citri TaxID=50023 RepID=UPI002307B789|nr:mediator of RNA polymerase II transcription subunit 30-like [Panonychus citri]